MQQHFRDSLSPDTAVAAELFQHDGALSEVDPAIADLIKQEKGRQIHGLELIASENFTSRAVHLPLPFLPAGAASAVVGTTLVFIGHHLRSATTIQLRDEASNAMLRMTPTGDAGGGLLHDEQVLGGTAGSALLWRQRVHRPGRAPLPGGSAVHRTAHRQLALRGKATW